MKRIFAISMLGIAFTLIMGLYIMGSESQAQRTIERDKIKPPVRDIPKICMKPDLSNWQDNLAFHPKEEFPFSSSCKSCYDKVGVMNLPVMSMWLSNKGAADAPASKAKMTWQDGKAPYQTRSIVVNVPAIPKGEKHLLRINVPANTFFQTAKPVKLELDSAKQIDECKEDNNSFTYTY